MECCFLSCYVLVYYIMSCHDCTHMFASVHSEDHEGAENGGQDTHRSFRPQLHPSSVAPPLLPQLFLLPNSFLSCLPLLPQLLLLPNSFLSCCSSPTSSAAVLSLLSHHQPQCPSDKTDLTVHHQDPGDSTDDFPTMQCSVALCSHTNLPPRLPG